MGDGSCSTPDGSGPSDVTVIDRAAFNQGANASYPPHIEQTELMDTLVARGPHAVGYSRATERTSSEPSAPETTRGSGASTSAMARSSSTSRGGVLHDPVRGGGRGDSDRAARQQPVRGQGAERGGDQGCLTPWDVQSKRVYAPSSVAPTLPSGTSEGLNIQPIVIDEVVDG